jgi:hypothetical protein
MAYHTRKINKGEIGEFSKIKEEFEELEDAELQQSKVLIICELTDLVGAIEEYAKSYGLTLKDLIQFSNQTKAAFNEGKRK